MKTIAALLISITAYAASPAEMAISKAQADISKNPDHAPYYNALAMAYARRAREISDVQFYGKAEEALQHALQLSPDNYEALKIEAWLELGRHEFRKALETAKKLNRKTPDDVMVYGYLVDANVELGNYKDAVDAAQWMLDLRPGNTPGITRAAYLRELHGNLGGALELMQMAYDATAFGETEDRAWILTQMSHLEFVAGDLAKAEMYATGALNIFADYHYALGALAQVRTAQERYEEAVDLLRKRYTAAPHAENLYALAEALESAGHLKEAGQDYSEFERKSLAETNLSDNSNHELIAYYTDHAHQPQKGLEIARREFDRRKDVFTRDSYAWALAANGEFDAAAAQIDMALQVGVKDPKILRHARLIAERKAAAE